MFTVLDTRASHGIRQLMKTVFRVYRILRRYRKRLQRIVSYVLNTLFSIDYKLHVSNDFATVQGLRTAKKKKKGKRTDSANENRCFAWIMHLDLKLSFSYAFEVARKNDE